MKISKAVMMGILSASLLGGMAQADNAAWLNQARTAPVLVKQVAPEYPVEARAEGIVGTVMVQATVNKDGVVMDPKVVESSGDARLDQAALDAFAQWEFKPATIRGMAEATVVRVPIAFQLTDPEPEENIIQ